MTALRAAFFAAAVWASPLFAGDWPMWRYDAGRGGATPQELPAKLHLHWIAAAAAANSRPGPIQPKMQFDAVRAGRAGQRIFVGSSHDDSRHGLRHRRRRGSLAVLCRRAGPVRARWLGRAGLLRQRRRLSVLPRRPRTADLFWKFRGGPRDRKILGNERLISTWPARGGPVIADGKVYFAAGIWPFMGIFLHALDARTGEVAWTNDGDGSIYIKQPHNARRFAGVARKGRWWSIGDKLLVPGGRSVPACYDRARPASCSTTSSPRTASGGGSTCRAADRRLFNGGRGVRPGRRQVSRRRRRADRDRRRRCCLRAAAATCGPSIGSRHR